MSLWPALARVGEGDGSEHFAELRARISLIETMHNGGTFRCSGGSGAPTHAKVEFCPVAGGFVVS